MAETIEQLDARKDALAIRLQRLAQEPDPYIVESFQYETWQKASKCRRALILMLLNEMNRLNDEINALLVDDCVLEGERNDEPNPT